MNLTNALTRFVESNVVPFREASVGYGLASLSGIDADDNLYRRVGEDNRDLNSITDSRQREIAAYLNDTNPFAHSILGMKADFICGDAWSITAENPKVQDILDAHWYDPINNWPKKLYNRVLELGMFGEQCYTALTGADGVVRLGYVDPGVIIKVVPDKDNYEITREVILKATAPGEKDRKLKVINYDPARGRMVGLDPGEEGGGEYVGQCFFWAINKPTNATRGRSDLFSMSDTLDMIDQFHWSRVERAALINAFIWDVTLEGMDDAQITDWLKKQKAPKPGSMRGHNERVKYEAVAPNLGAGDASEEARMLRIPLLVGSRYPEHWLFGIGENANRASAYEMTDPPMRMMRTRQMFVTFMVRDVLTFQLDEATRTGRLPSSLKPEDKEFTIDTPELSSRDQAKIAQVTVNVSTSLAVAVQNDWLSNETARNVYAFVLSMMGMEIDPVTEAKRIVGEEGEADEEDFGNAPTIPQEEQGVEGEGEGEEEEEAIPA